MSRASGLTPAPMGSNCGWAIPCGRYSSAKAESESPRHAQGSQGRWQPGFQSHLTMAGRLPMSSQPLLEQSPNFPCLLNACFTLSFAQGSQWPRRVGGGCRTSAPRQDSAPWWKADASHHMGLASPRGKLSTSRYRSHVLLGQGLRVTPWEAEPAGGTSAVRRVLQGHTGPFLHRLNVWRGRSSLGWAGMRQEARAPGWSLYTPVTQCFPSPDLRFIVRGEVP